LTECANPERSLRSLSNIAERRTSDALVMLYNGKCFQKFWKHVKAAEGPSKQTLTTELDGFTTESDISQHWSNIYEELFCSNQSERYADDVESYIKNHVNSDNTVITHAMIHKAILALKCNKAIGSDGVQAEHWWW